jgi:hypothetical protein
MLENEERANITATEVAARQKEKMEQLGPVMDRLDSELYSPAITRAVSILFRQGAIPPAPPTLGADYRIELISIMAQARKMADTAGIDRLVQFTAQLAAATQNPAALDKLKTDEAVDTYAESLGVPAKLVRTDDEVAQLRAQRQKQQDAQAKLQQAMMLAQGAKAASQADMSGDNMLTRLAGSLPGPAAAAIAPNLPGGNA